MDFTSQKRNASVGETVLYYETGDVNSVPVPAEVTAVSDIGAMLSVHLPRRSRHKVVEWSRHVNDPYWKGREGLRQKNGAWEFHPVYGPLFTKYLNLEKARTKKLEKLEEEQALSADEYEALKALEVHGPVISRIATDTGMSPDRLNSLPRFNEAFKSYKLQRWEEKNSKATSVDDIDVEDGESSDDDVEFARSRKDAMTLLGMTADEWDEMRSRDGFPKHQPGKGWPMDEVREWMSGNLVEAGT